VGTDADKILAAYEEVMATGGKAGRVPELWDGSAAQRIVEAINQWAAGRA
jgi:UDP-N-acetylglucosamine 2-epimerase (non-hydrolysing)